MYTDDVHHLSDSSDFYLIRTFLATQQIIFLFDSEKLGFLVGSAMSFGHHCRISLCPLGSTSIIFAEHLLLRSASLCFSDVFDAAVWLPTFSCICWMRTLLCNQRYMIFTSLYRELFGAKSPQGPHRRPQKTEQSDNIMMFARSVVATTWCSQGRCFHNTTLIKEKIPGEKYCNVTLCALGAHRPRLVKFTLWSKA